MTREKIVRDVIETIEGGPYRLTYYDKSIDDIPQKAFDDFLECDGNLLDNYHFRIKNQKMIIEIDDVYFDDRIEIDMRLMRYDDYLLKYGNEDNVFDD